MVTISFLGDISFNDEYNHLFGAGINPFEQMESILSNSDLVVGNLECLAKGDSGENTLKKPRLKTNVASLSYLKNLNIGLISLAHNHIYDNLLDGYLKTIHFLNDNNINYLGAGKSQDEASKPIFLEINKHNFCFLNYVTEDTNPSLPHNSELYINMFDPNRIIQDIQLHKDKFIIILLLHWGGNVEGCVLPQIKQREYARKFIDEGADLTIGHHSHTMQPFEVYKNKYIFYSLGNFCFADVHSDGKIKKIKENKYKESGILNVYFDQQNYKTEIMPIRNNNLFIQRDDKLLSKFQRRNFFFKVIGLSKYLWHIYYFYFKSINPIIFQLKRKDPNKTLIKRIININFKKVKQLLK
jgi:poly-gamma-glutamate synthesis protein (capsule biosynthesis protein)